MQCVKEVSRKGGGLEREMKTVCFRQGWKGQHDVGGGKHFSGLESACAASVCSSESLTREDSMLARCIRHTISECLDDDAVTKPDFTLLKVGIVDRIYLDRIEHI